VLQDKEVQLTKLSKLFDAQPLGHENPFRPGVENASRLSSVISSCPGARRILNGSLYSENIDGGPSGADADGQHPILRLVPHLKWYAAWSDWSPWPSNEAVLLVRRERVLVPSESSAIVQLTCSQCEAQARRVVTRNYLERTKVTSVFLKRR
jgi:hypothetical protein